MAEVVYGNGMDTSPEEVAEFYARLKHPLQPSLDALRNVISHSIAFVTARVDGQLVGVARGLSDGVRGYLTECKLDPAYQGPAAVTRTDGRIEHDTHGIARAMAERVLARLFEQGVQRVDALAWGTEVDFTEELGFRRSGGLVGLTLAADEWAAQAAPSTQAASA